jgi:hypothetical protein
LFAPGTGGLAVQQAMAHAPPVIVAEGDGTQADSCEANGWQIASTPGALTTVSEGTGRHPGFGGWGPSSRIVSTEINIERMVQVFIQAATKNN